MGINRKLSKRRMKEREKIPSKEIVLFVPPAPGTSLMVSLASTIAVSSRGIMAAIYRNKFMACMHIVSFSCFCPVNISDE
jgi:hypothetical protein